MSGVAGHLVRRGVQAVAVKQPTADDFYISVLQWQAKQYSEGQKIQPWQWMILGLTVAAFTVLYASVRYTLGEVVSSLAMIEQPGVTASIALSDDPDAPIEKDAQIEVVQEKPVTASIRKTVRHLAHLGGFTARWRGLSASIIYHMLHGVAAQFIGGLISFFVGSGPIGFFTSTIAASVLLSRIHMTWTHVMISLPSQLAWYKRVPRGRFYFKALALPSFVFALSQQLFIALPALVFLALGPVPTNMKEVDSTHESVRVLLTLATAGLVGISILLPASVTLTRVEASLLPDDQETVVRFDRTLGGAAASAISLSPANARNLFVAAWKTFDRPSRLRLIKFYAKTMIVLTVISFVMFVALGGEVAAIGTEKFEALAKSTVASLQLKSMGAPLQ